MANGGARPGAGRKPGAATTMNEEARKKALEGGLSPLEYLLSVMRDIRQDDARRLDAAKAAAPYVHARLNAVTVTGDAEKLVKINRMTDAELEAIATSGGNGIIAPSQGSRVLN